MRGGCRRRPPECPSVRWYQPPPPGRPPAGAPVYPTVRPRRVPGRGGPRAGWRRARSSATVRSPPARRSAPPPSSPAARPRRHRREAGEEVMRAGSFDSSSRPRQRLTFPFGPQPARCGRSHAGRAPARLPPPAAHADRQRSVIIGCSRTIRTWTPDAALRTSETAAADPHSRGECLRTRNASDRYIYQRGVVWPERVRPRSRCWAG